jgi:hypothetical protein
MHARQARQAMRASLAHSPTETKHHQPTASRVAGHGQGTTPPSGPGARTVQTTHHQRQDPLQDNRHYCCASLDVLPLHAVVLLEIQAVLDGLGTAPTSNKRNTVYVKHRARPSVCASMHTCAPKQPRPARRQQPTKAKGNATPHRDEGAAYLSMSQPLSTRVHISSTTSL